jgi:hypothetical protein
MKKSTALILLVLLAVVILASPSDAKPQPKIILNGSTLSLDAPPIERNGLLFVPLRGIFENMGAKVIFTKSEGKIFAYKSKTSVLLFLGNNQAKVNGFTTHILYPPFANNGRAYVPLRFVSEAMGCEVNWHPPTGTVAITSSPSSSVAPRKKTFAEQQLESLLKPGETKEKDDGKIKKINSGIKKIEPVKGIDPIEQSPSTGKKIKTTKEKDRDKIDDIKFDD